MAEGLGFEPRYSGSKPDVLPLDDPSTVIAESISPIRLATTLLHGVSRGDAIVAQRKICPLAARNPKAQLLALAQTPRPRRSPYIPPSSGAAPVRGWHRTPLTVTVSLELTEQVNNPSHTATITRCERPEAPLRLPSYRISPFSASALNRAVTLLYARVGWVALTSSLMQPDAP